MNTPVNATPASDRFRVPAFSALSASRGLRGARAFVELLRDPDDLPKVFTVIDTLSVGTERRILARMQASDTGRRLLEARADLVPLLRDRAALAALPEGSLGRAYLAFVESEGISADGILAASEAGTAATELDPQIAWIRQRMRDTHDLWHALTGYRGDVLGELALLAFLYAQTGNPAMALMATGGTLRFFSRDGAARATVLEGYRRGRAAAWLPDVEWEVLLDRPVSEVRAHLGIAPLTPYRPVRSTELRPAALPG